MRLRTLLCPILLFAALCSALSHGIAAQAPLEPAQLPARTIFYLIWRGTPAADTRRTNALMSLWDDPDFAPVRAAMLDSLMNDSKKQPDKPSLSREAVAQYATLLDNPFTIGYLPRPEASAPKTAAPGAAAPPAWDGTFLVYDRTGKEALLSKAVLRMRAAGTDIPKLTELTIAGVPSLKVERKSGTTYWAETGQFAVSAAEPSVFEEVLKRIAANPTGSSLADSDAYHEAKPLLAGGVMEFFLRVPQVKEMTGASASTSPQLAAFWKSFRLDAIHVFAGHISLEGTRTRLQGGVLGDTAEGSLFDIWAAGQSQPESLALLNADTVYYNESQLSLLGIYNTIKRALTQPGSNSAAIATTVENSVQTRIGMPLPDAFSLTSGEFGTLQSSPILDPDKKNVFAGIRNKPDALKLMRTIFSDQLTSEHNEGNVTYLKISLKGSQGTKGVAQWKFYHLAMTPNLLIGADNSDTLHATIEQLSAGGASLPKNFQAARSQFPDKLNGFSYFDLQKLDWPALKQRMADQAAKTAAATKTTDGDQKAKQFNGWLTNVDPAVFPRHLHSMTGASWKDATGVHFDEWVD
jgi:hypothetical protein